METVLLLIGTGVGYIIAYHTYGKWISEKLFGISDKKATPAHEMQDDQDYCPTKKGILFGHHFTSIAGTGPIVGPAVAVIWGWVPAVLWVFFGSIFMGAVHDFGAIVISARNEGKSIGDLSGGIITPRVQLLFMMIILLVLFVLIAVFALVVGVLFKMYPQAVIPVWVGIPIATTIGWLIYKKKMPALIPSLIALVLLYVFVVVGAYNGVNLPEQGFLGRGPIFDWVIILLVYAFVASVLPVWLLLQPRDYINGHQLIVAMSLLFSGILIAHPPIVAPALNLSAKGAPSFWPFLFITIACGAISGFHSLVGSGTSSKQLDQESDAKCIGYGGMLTESFLSILVIIACVAGIGIGFGDKVGISAWNSHYGSWGSAAGGLGAKLKAFVEGSANMLTSLGLPRVLCLGIMGVLIASFAGTSMDTATRLQRYTITEFMKKIGLGKFSNKYFATLLAVVPAGLLALHDGQGKGGLTLWPLFGTLNQLIACLSLLVLTVYLAKKTKNILATLIPMLFLLAVTSVGMYENLNSWISKAFAGGQGKWIMLSIIGVFVVILEIWILIESAVILIKLKKITKNNQNSNKTIPYSHIQRGSISFLSKSYFSHYHSILFNSLFFKEFQNFTKLFLFVRYLHSHKWYLPFLQCVKYPHTQQQEYHILLQQRNHEKSVLLIPL